MADKDNFIRVRFASDETGWAEKLEDGRIRVVNHPLAEDLMFGDIVELSDPEGCNCCPTIVKVVEREYPVSLGVGYPRGNNVEETKANYKAVCEVLQDEFGCMVEGMVAGMALAAAPATFNEEATQDAVEAAVAKRVQGVEFTIWERELRGA